MLRKKDNDIEWLEFELLADFPHLKHQIFLRQGGFSRGPYAGLNTGFQVGDSEAHVEANLALIQSLLKKEIPDWYSFIFSLASHGTSIAYIDAQSSQKLIGYDGLITSTPLLTLRLGHADCQIAFIYDPIHHAAALIHSGWRGNAANIYASAIQHMQDAIGSVAADLLVCISPSLGPDAAEFIHYKTELPEELWSFQIRPTYFDFWSIAEFQLQRAGILPHHMEVARLCTFSNNNDFFSHRRDKITGRHAACMTLLPR